MSAAAAPTSTAPTHLDALVAKLQEGSRRFVKLSIDQRIALLEQVRANYFALAEEMVRAACQAKGIPLGTPLVGEEWAGGPMVTVRNMRLLLDALHGIRAKGVPEVKRSWIRTLPDGRIAVKVFPNDAFESVMLAGHLAEAYLQPGITAENLSEHQASFYKNPHQGRVCLVLGAGNVNAIPPTDALHKMFVEGAVCVVKMNPVNAYVGPFLERAFAPAVEQGFFAVAYGGVEESSYLVNHAGVDEVHITGSDKTHDTLVWGPPGPEREARKARNEPLLKKAITSELGNISPILVVPGPYSQSELDFQGRNLAGMLANNASFNCNSAKLLVTPKGWEGRPRLLEAIERQLGRAAVRKAYYPGAEQRWKQFVEGRPSVKLVGKAGPGELPYALITDVDPSRADDAVFTQEPWCSVLSETQLEAGDAATFLERAVHFVNERVWGTLCITLILHPASLKDPKTAEAVEKAVDDLRYGTVTFNTWPATVFGFMRAPWGGHPSSTLQDIQSGRGFVHNTLMLEGVEKTVVRTPLKVSPLPLWFPGHRSVDVLARKVTEFEMKPSWLKVPGVALAGFRA